MRATITLPNGHSIEAAADLHDLRDDPRGLEYWQITASRIDWTDLGAIHTARQATIQLDDGRTADVLVAETGGTAGEERSGWARFQVDGKLNPARP